METILKLYVKILIVATTVILAQLYYHLTTCVVFPIDSFQDYAFVIGHSFADLIGQQYQYYLYGFVPLTVAYLGVNLCHPFPAFFLTNTLFAIGYSILITLLVMDYTRLNKFLTFILTLSLTCLLLNPGESVFGWKIPYTIALSLGVIFSLQFFKLSVDYFENQKPIYLYFLILAGGFAISTKVEFAAVIIVYFFLYSAFIFYREGKHRHHVLLISALIVFLGVAYISWLKLLPPFLKLGSWCSDNVSYEILFNEISTTSTQQSLQMSNHLKKIIGLAAVDISQAFDFLFQSVLLILFMSLEKFPHLSKDRATFYKFAILSVYCIYLFAMAWLVPEESVKNVLPLAFFIILFNIKPFASEPKMLLLAIFASLFCARTIFNVTFSSFSVFYIFPCILLFIAVVNHYIRNDLVIVFYAVVFCLILIPKFDVFISYNSKIGKSLSYAQNNPLFNFPPLSVDSSMYEITHKIKALEKECPVRTIASAKNIPFFNLYFEKQNPIKKYVNVEFYPFIYDSCFEKYMANIKSEHPDVFIYAKKHMRNYVTSEERRNLSNEFFIQKDQVFREKIGKLYKRVMESKTFYIKQTNMTLKLQKSGINLLLVR